MNEILKNYLQNKKKLLPLKTDAKIWFWIRNVFLSCLIPIISSHYKEVL